jgi:hypothetical protein
MLLSTEQSFRAVTFFFLTVVTHIPNVEVSTEFMRHLHNQASAFSNKKRWKKSRPLRQSIHPGTEDLAIIIDLG